MNEKYSHMTAKLSLISMCVIFFLLIVTMLLSNIILLFLIRHGLIEDNRGGPLIPFLFQSGMVSIITGTALAYCIVHLPLRSIQLIIQAIHEVSEGNFHVKLHLEHPKEFQKLSQSFNQMTAELASIEILRTDFINNFSHEFKTPIVSILGFAKLLKRGNLSYEEEQEYLDIIIEESQRLSTLSTTVLNLSKVESLSLLTDKGPVLLSEQIREAVLLLEKKWDKKQIQFDFQMEELWVTANESLLKQVWLNLLDNAIKFSPVNGKILISLSRTDHHICFSIEDEGPGMDDTTIRCIFDKFYQGDPSHAMEGNGLGLPLVRKIIELHKGDIIVKSYPGKGSVFSVLLPS